MHKINLFAKKWYIKLFVNNNEKALFKSVDLCFFLGRNTAFKSIDFQFINQSILFFFLFLGENDNFDEKNIIRVV